MDSDPLHLLRSALINSPSSIHLLDSSSQPVSNLSSAEYISLPSSSSSSNSILFPKSTPTRYTTASNISSVSGVSTYSLATLLFAYEQKNSTVTDYLKNARELNLEFIAITDRRLLIDYLSGKIDENETGGRILPITSGSGIELQSEVEEKKKKSGGDELVEREVGIDQSKVTQDQPTTSTSSKRSLDSDSSITPSTSTSTPVAALGDSSSSSSTTTTNLTSLDRPSNKKFAYTTNKEDVEKVKRMMNIIQGPQYAYQSISSSNVPGGNGDSSNSGGKIDEKVGFAVKNRETVLRGDRTNVSLIHI